MHTLMAKYQLDMTNSLRTMSGKFIAICGEHVGFIKSHQFIYLKLVNDM